MGYFVVAVVIANYIEVSQENMLSSSAIGMQCVCVMSNRQDVCRTECSASITKEPDEFERQSEVNDLQYIKDDKIVVK